MRVGTRSPFSHTLESRKRRPPTLRRGDPSLSSSLKPVFIGRKGEETRFHLLPSRNINTTDVLIKSIRPNTDTTFLL